jgi:hypothetical protein
MPHDVRAYIHAFLPDERHGIPGCVCVSLPDVPHDTYGLLHDISHDVLPDMRDDICGVLR